MIDFRVNAPESSINGSHAPQGSGISQDFTSLKGKRLGYVGEFGKIQIDELTKYYGMKPEDYTSIRCGMNISKALIEGKIDAGIGLENSW